MFYQILLSLQAKRSAIITEKHGIYKLPHEYAKQLKTCNLRKLKNIGEVSQPHRMIA